MIGFLRAIAHDFGKLFAFLAIIFVGITISVTEREQFSRSAKAESSSPSPPERNPLFEAVLHSDLVIRGQVASVRITPELFDKVLPNWPATLEEGTTTNVAHVRMAIDEVLRGTAPADTVAFIVHVGMSHTRDNYEVGDQMVVGLVWGANVLQGMYWLYDDSGRFARTPGGWQQQSGNQPIVSLEAIKLALASVTPERLLADADAIVVGKLVREVLEYRLAPSGQEYALLKYQLSETEILKGDADASNPEVCVITSGDYWPNWRDNSTFPRDLKRGQRYCFFLRRADIGFAVLAGMSGVYEVRKDGLVLPGRKFAVLTIDDVKAAARSGE